MTVIISSATGQRTQRDPRDPARRDTRQAQLTLRTLTRVEQQPLAVPQE